MVTQNKNWRTEALGLMFQHGAHEEELKACIHEKQVQLRLNGAKLRNLPAGSKASSFFATLPDAAIEVVRGWFLEKAKFEGSPSLQEAIDYLRVQQTDGMGREAAKPYWRAILAAFCQEQSESLRDFLSNPPERQKARGAELAGPAPLPALAIDPANLGQCLAVLKGEGSMNGPLAALVFGLVAAGRGDQQGVNRAREAIAAGNLPDSLALDDLLLAAGAHAIPMRSGLRLRTPKKLSDAGLIDPEEVLPLAIVKKYLLTGQFFAYVVGVMVSGELVMVTPDEAKLLYKYSGDITAFPKSLPANHYENEAGLWRVEHHNNDKNTQFIIKSHEARVYDVVDVPHASGDPDAVRAWLQTQFQARHGYFPIFQLADGVLVRMPGDTDPAMSRFDRPLEMYESLEAYDLGQSRRIVLGALPASTGKYDCSPVSILLKRILVRAREASIDFPAFSNAQITALGEFLALEEVEPVGASLQRASQRLAQAANLREALQDSLGEIMAIKQVVEQVEEEKAKIVDRFVKERASEEAVLANLKEQQRQAIEATEAARKMARQQEGDLVRNIKTAFERARADGIRTLADVALFQGLLGSTTPPTPTRESPSPTLTASAATLATAEIGDPVTSSTELTNTIRRAARASRLSPQLLCSVLAAAKTCGAVGLWGGRRSSVASAISTIVSGGVYCQISAGADVFSPADLMRRPAAVISGNLRLAMSLGEFLEQQGSLGRACVVEVIGANRAPLEAYLPELLEAVSRDDGMLSIPWTDNEGKVRGGELLGPVLFLLGFVAGQSIFPLSEHLSRELPICTVDHEWGDEATDEGPLTMRPRHMPLDGWKSITPSLISARQERLSMALSRLGMAESEAADLAAVMLHGGRPGYTLEASAGFSRRLLDALAKSPVLASDGNPQRENGA